MTYFEVIQKFITAFLPVGSVLPVVGELLTALLAIGGVLLILGFAMSLLGVRSRMLSTVTIILMIVVSVLYFWSVTPWYTPMVV